MVFAPYPAERLRPLAGVGGVLHCLDDILVAGATAEVAAKRAGIDSVRYGISKLFAVLASDHSPHLRMVDRLSHVDAHDAGVGIGAADDSHIAHLRQTHIGGILTPPGHQLGVEQAGNRTTSYSTVAAPLGVSVAVAGRLLLESRRGQAGLRAFDILVRSASTRAHGTDDLSALPDR
jgi:hypothetical protein